MIAWTWTLVALAGLILSLWLANDSRLDLRSLRRAGVANGRRALARIWLAIDLLLATAQAGNFILGLTIPARHIDPSPTVLVLIYGNVVMMAVSLLNASLRHLLYSTREGEPPIPKPDGET